MMQPILTRVERRETHSPRTTAAIIVLAVVILLAIYAGTEIVLDLVGVDPLLITPGSLLAWLVALPDQSPQAAVIAVGVALGIVGLVLVWLGIGPGRLAKHRIGVSDHLVLADNGVIASATAEQVRRELDLPHHAVTVGLGHRGADVVVQPEPGRVLEKDRVRAAAAAELDRYALRPGVKVRARVARPDDEGGR